ncbi:MAG: hypothetical protein GX145_01865 [Clostridiaceae bacterium]|nr:hypothetical protein [Clostridiaceae bacterium]
MFLSLVYVIIFAISGIFISEALFPTHKLEHRIWLGLVFGLFLWTWLPALLAFFLGFTLTVQILALILVVAIGSYSAFLVKRRKNKPDRLAGPKFSKQWQFIVLTAIFMLGYYLFSTHILRQDEQGYFGGQTTFGDLSMHLGFISSIAEQGVFPPEYSIFAGQAVNYPFLSETSASTLLQLGSNLRQAYLISALYAYAMVILGVFFFFEQWLKRRGRAVLATLLFFFGSGFGFAYFFDLGSGSATVLQRLLDSFNENNLQIILDGFYQTPTNLPAIGLRWVNPIVDMLIPQRATLFGWAILFPCLYLLLDWAFQDNKRSLIPLTILAGGLPLIHTHSFLALGVISATYLAIELIAKLRKGTFSMERVRGWLIYSCGAILPALPQLIAFTFVQVSESSMVRFHFNWANELDNFFCFYIKNWGWLFLLAVPAFCCLTKRDRHIMSGPLVLWGLAELIVFQPNTYDNNKLIFVSFAFLCGLIARFVSFSYRRINHALTTEKESNVIYRSYIQATLLILLIIFGYWLIKLLQVKEATTFKIRFSSSFSILLLLLMIIWLLVQILYGQYKYQKNKQFLLIATSLAVVFIMGSILLKQIFSQYQSEVLSINQEMFWFLLILIFLAIVSQSITLFSYVSSTQKSGGLAKVALSLCCFWLALTTFLSSSMTIIREVRSNYLLFGSEEIEAAEYIKQDTETDVLFLTDANWHLNPVSSLTGRNILCGSDTFLYFHGIDTSERRRDVKLMLEDPENNFSLYEHYGIDLVYIGHNERRFYDLDTDYFMTHFNQIYDSESIKIYRVITP